MNIHTLFIILLQFCFISGKLKLKLKYNIQYQIGKETTSFYTLRDSYPNLSFMECLYKTMEGAYLAFIHRNETGECLLGYPFSHSTSITNELVNIIKKPIRQINPDANIIGSSHDGRGFTHVVDGDMDTFYHSVGRDKYKYLIIDLSRKYKIYSVSYLTRHDTIQVIKNRLLHVDIRISEEDVNTVTNQIFEGVQLCGNSGNEFPNNGDFIHITVTCSTPLIGRYLILQRSSTTIGVFEFNEIYFYGIEI